MSLSILAIICTDKPDNPWIEQRLRHPFRGRVDAYHARAYETSEGTTYTLRIEVGLPGFVDGRHGTEAAVCAEAIGAVRAVFPDAKVSAHAAVVDHCDWYSIEVGYDVRGNEAQESEASP
jgi:hypothetical protein